MAVAIWLVILFVCFAVAMHVLSIVIVGLRSQRTVRLLPLEAAPPVSVLRPVCGIDNAVETTLRSTFEFEWPDYEIIFCCASDTDPVVPLVERLIAEYPHIPARLLTGDDRISINPKLNNLVKGWSAAQHEWILMSDSNVLLPRNYLRRLMAQWSPRTGLVCSPPVGGDPVGFAAEVECAFLNTYEARWQIVADSIGMGFAQGKTMLWRRDVLDRAGGIPALARETAEDAAATKVVREAGLSVHLDPGPFIQPLGRRDWRSVWNRQVRWARLRRSSFKQYFVLELISGGFCPLAGAASLAWAGSIPVFAPFGLAIFWYGSEMLLDRLAGWHVSFRSLPAYLLRDLLIPPLWVAAWAGNSFNWRGNAMQIERETTDGKLAGLATFAANIVNGSQPLGGRRILPAAIARRLKTRAGRSPR